MGPLWIVYFIFCFLVDLAPKRVENKKHNLWKDLDLIPRSFLKDYTYSNKKRQLHEPYKKMQPNSGSVSQFL